MSLTQSRKLGLGTPPKKVILISGFLFIGVNSVNFRYALYRRIPKIYAMILTGTAIGFSSLIFQTVTNNRILTPSILGIDSLYVLLQTTVVFLLGSSSAIISVRSNCPVLAALMRK